MNISYPEMRREGDTFTFTWSDFLHKLVFDQLREGRDGDTHAEITVLEEPAPPGSRGHVHWAKFNLTSTETRKRMATFLQEKTQVKNGFWPVALEQACTITVEEFRKGEPFYDLAEVEEPTCVHYLVDPLMPLGETTILFGKGEACKSFLAMAIAISLRVPCKLPGGLKTNGNGRVLYLDWETNRHEHRRRLGMVQRGLDISQAPEGIIYRYMSRPLADEIALVRREVAARDIKLVIVDSIGQACGGDPRDPGPANAFMAAMRSLGAVTRLAIGHVSWEGSDSKVRAHTYGSIFFEFMARSVWEAKADAEEQPVQVALFQPKVNIGARGRPIGIEVSFNDEDREVWFSDKDVADMPMLSGRLSCAMKIRRALKQHATSGRMGGLSVKEIADAIGEKEPVVKTTLARMQDTMNLDPGRGRGHAGQWVLLADREDETK